MRRLITLAVLHREVPAARAWDRDEDRAAEQVHAWLEGICGPVPTINQVLPMLEHLLGAQIIDD